MKSDVNIYNSQFIQFLKNKNYDKENKRLYFIFYWIHWIFSSKLTIFSLCTNNVHKMIKGVKIE